MENITLTVAIIGCITGIIGCVAGICSLVLNFYKVLSERPKLKIEVIKPYLNGFIDNKNTAFKCDKVLIINIRIINTGVVPVSIKAIKIHQYNDVLFSCFSYKLDSVVLLNNNEKNISYKLNKQIELPFFVEAGKIYETSLIFPNADNFYKIYKEKNMRFLFIDIICSLFTITEGISIRELTYENIKTFYKLRIIKK